MARFTKPREDRQRMTRDVRNLIYLKTATIHLGHGIPEPNEGENGHLRLNFTNSGCKLYAKIRNKWYAFTPDQGEDKSCYKLDDVTNNTVADINKVVTKVNEILEVLRTADIVNDRSVEED